MDPDTNWKGWKGRWTGRDFVDGRIGYGCRLEGLEGTLDPDVFAGRVGSERCFWKGRWIRTLLLIVPIDDIVVVVDCSDRRCYYCCGGDGYKV